MGYSQFWRTLAVFGLLLFPVVIYSQAPPTPLTQPSSPASTQKQPSTARKSTPPDSVVITVGETRITAREVDKMLESFPRNSRGYYAGPGRKQLADVIVNMKLLAEEAEKRKLDEREDVKTAIKIARNSILMEAARSEMQKEIEFNDTVGQKFLDEHKTQFEEAKVRRIVICSASSVAITQGQERGPCLPDQEAQAKAEDIRKQLLQGADFEELAAKFSADRLSLGKGGDLGYIKRGHQVPLIVPPVEEVIFSIKVGEISEVIPSAFGLEIVKVEDRRVPKLEVVRKQIEQEFRKQAVEDQVKAMKNKAGVKVDDDFFAPILPASGVSRH